jgi:glycosyltransferase involved in cell wall biosynthesis
MPPVAPVPVGVFLTSFWPGGTERQTLELVRRLDRRRFAVHVACFHREGTWLPLVERYADSVTEFPISSFKSRGALRAAADFRAWCRSRELAVLHAADLYANVFALPLAFSARVPVRIGSRREINPDRTPAQIGVQRCAYAFAHRIVANSSAAAARLRTEGIRKRHVAHIPNGIDLDVFHPPAETPNLQRLVTVARLRPEKGHDTLVDAFAGLSRTFPEARLTIVGDGPVGEAIAARVKALGLEGRILLAGHRDDVGAALREHGLFILASRSDAFPNSVIEAMATGLPVIATTVGGIPELIEHGRNGLLVTPGKPAELERTMTDLLRRPSFARALGRKARVDVAAQYSFDRMVRDFENLYLSALTERRAHVVAPVHSRRPVTS